jgi:hypothetical protein
MNYRVRQSDAKMDLVDSFFFNKQEKASITSKSYANNLSYVV